MSDVRKAGDVAVTRTGKRVLLGIKGLGYARLSTDEAESLAEALQICARSSNTGLQDRLRASIDRGRG